MHRRNVEVTVQRSTIEEILLPFLNDITTEMQYRFGGVHQKTVKLLIIIAVNLSDASNDDVWKADILFP